MVATRRPRLTRFDDHSAVGREVLRLDSVSEVVGADPVPRCSVEPMCFGGDEVLEPPVWLRKMVQGGEGPGEVLKALEARVLRGAVDLHMAQLIVNEIGRRLLDGGLLVRGALTQELVFKLMRRNESNAG